MRQHQRPVIGRSFLLHGISRQRLQVPDGTKLWTDNRRETRYWMAVPADTGITRTGCQADIQWGQSLPPPTCSCFFQRDIEGVPVDATVVRQRR